MVVFKAFKGYKHITLLEVDGMHCNYHTIPINLKYVLTGEYSAFITFFKQSIYINFHLKFYQLILVLYMHIYYR